MSRDDDGLDWSAPERSSRFDDDVLGLRGVREHDETLAADVLDPGAEPAQDLRPRRRRRRNPLLIPLALLLALAVVVAGSVFAFSSLRDLIPSLGPFAGGTEEPADYPGPGTGEITVKIPEGAGGGQIAEVLASQGVVASATGFTNALAANPEAANIQPGTYRMAKQMSYASAMARLMDGNYREIHGVTVREGLWVNETFDVLARATGHKVSEYKKVDPALLGLPEAANGKLEGYLFPSTYEFAPDATPEEQLKAMVDLGKKVYADLGIEDSELNEVLTKASIVQGEGMYADDLPKVARVVENRLAETAQTGGRLQMDSTIHFIEHQRGLAGTTDTQRAVDSPYNTYLHPGLPPGPIDSPGEAAIKAALDPTPGDWLYFVTVNPDTGETKFTASYDEHNKNVAQFEQWCADNPDRC